MPSLFGKCEFCPLQKRASNPKIGPSGKGKAGIVIVGEAPGYEEDREGENFVGRSGRLLKGILEDFGLRPMQDCVYTNAMQCFPGNSDDKDQVEMEKARRSCRARLCDQIEEAKPSIILALGKHAIQSILNPPQKLGNLNTQRAANTLFPSQEFGCWVACHLHPAYLLRNEGEEKYWSNQIGNMLVEGMEKPLPKLPEQEEIEVITPSTPQDAIGFLQREKPVALDFETTSLIPHKEEFRFLSVALCEEGSRQIPVIPLGKPFLPWSEEENKDVLEALKELVSGTVPKVIHNSSYENRCCLFNLGTEINNIEWDTQQTAHILSPRPRTSNLDFQVYRMTGGLYSEYINQKNLAGCSWEDVSLYNAYDVFYLWKIKDKQKKEMNEEQIQTTNNLFLPATKMLDRMSYEGVLIKNPQQEIEKLAQREQELETKVQSSPEADQYKRRFLKPPSTSSNDDLSCLLFNVLKLKPAKETEKGAPSVDAEAIGLLKEESPEHSDLFDCVLKLRAIRKISSTYLTGFLQLIDKSYILHPSFSLTRVATFRSSSSDPNFQNIPSRGEESDIVRKLLVPKREWWLQCDLSGIEVCIIAMFSKDEKLLDFLRSGGDPHRYWASKLFDKPEEEITKDERYKAKNGFVFPKFYGSSDYSCAKNLEMTKTHVKKMGREFLRVHKGVSKWQQRTYDFYKEKGYVENLYGLRRPAPLTMNMVYNSPIQGTAFLLWLEILLDAEKRLWELKSKMVGQTHDSAVFDAVEGDLGTIIEVLNEEAAKERHPWQILPIELEWELGGTWADMEEL